MQGALSLDGELEQNNGGFGAAYCPCAMPKAAPLFLVLSPPPSLAHLPEEIIVGNVLGYSTALIQMRFELPLARLTGKHGHILWSPVVLCLREQKNLHAKDGGIAVALETGKNYPRAFSGRRRWWRAGFILCVGRRRSS